MASPYRRTRQLGILLAAAALVAAVPAASAQTDLERDFPLTQVVPADMFFTVFGRSNPDAAFAEQYWYEVWEAFVDSGVTQDLVELVVTSLDEEQQAEWERMRGRFATLIGAVRWSSMHHADIAFAERLGRFQVEGDEIKGMIPDYLMVMRLADADAAQENFAALTALLDAAVDEIATLAETPLRVERATTHDVHTATFDLTQRAERAPRMPLTVGHAGRVLFVSMGAEIRDDMIARLGAGEGKPVVGSNEKFRAAVAKLPPAGETVMFVDMANLAASLERMFAAIGEKAGDDEEAQAFLRLTARMVDSLRAMDSSVMVQNTRPYETVTDSLLILADDARERAIYPVMQTEPLADFARYLPAGTRSFSVDSGISLSALYDFIRDSFHTLGAPGEEAWTHWTALQQEWGFDVQRDLLAWLGSGHVTAEFELDGAPAWICFVQVHDEAAARAAVASGLDELPEMLRAAAADVPPLGMLTFDAVPLDELEHFHEITVPLFQMSSVCGVRDGWLMMGSSADAVRAALATAAGERAGLRSDEGTMKRLQLAPETKPIMISLTNHGDDAKEAAAIVGGLSMGGSMVAMAIPEPQVQQKVVKVFTILSKLSPVIAKLDFFDATASHTTFDGQEYRTHAVTYYRPPQETGGTPQ